MTAKSNYEALIAFLDNNREKVLEFSAGAAHSGKRMFVMIPEFDGGDIVLSSAPWEDHMRRNNIGLGCKKLTPQKLQEIIDREKQDLYMVID
jgi:hypothetical protein